MAYPSTPQRPFGFAFAHGTPGTPMPAPVTMPSIQPKYSAEAMRMGLAKSSMPATFARPVVHKGPVNNNVMETRVLGAFNESTGHGWIEGSKGRSRKARKASRSRKARKASRNRNRSRRH